MTDVYLEVGKRKAFAGAVDWPGWCRWGKGEDAALEALADYAPRYAEAVADSGVPFDATGVDFTVVETMPGNATTDFGAPGIVGDCDAQAVSTEEASRFTALLRACWDAFDDVVAGAPAVLRKGPRGGGRDRDKVVDHVLQAEASYARKIGVRLKAPDMADADAVAQLRDAICHALDAASDGAPLVEKGWPARYAFRRIAWHVTDHAWEIEDRSDAG